MNFFAGISWGAFLSVVIPIFILSNILIWLYYKKYDKNGGQKESRESDRFSPRPVSEDDVPDDDEGFICNESKSDNADNLLSDIEDEVRQQKEMDNEKERMEAKKREMENQRKQEGIPESFDQPQEFDENEEPNELPEEQKEFMYEQYAKRMFQSAEEYVQTGDAVIADGSSYVEDDCNYGGQGDFDALVDSYDLSGRPQTENERKMVDQAIAIENALKQLKDSAADTSAELESRVRDGLDGGALTSGFLPLQNAVEESFFNENQS